MNFNDNAGLSCTLKHFSSPKSLSKNALESVTNASWTRVPQLCLNLFSVMRNAVLCNGELKKSLKKILSASLIVVHDLKIVVHAYLLYMKIDVYGCCLIN